MSLENLVFYWAIYRDSNNSSIMSSKDSIWFKALRWIQKKLVHTIVVPQDPFEDLNLDPTRPLAYVMRTESLSDIAALSEITDSYGLPSPYEPLEVNGVVAPELYALRVLKPSLVNVCLTNTF